MKHYLHPAASFHTNPIHTEGTEVQAGELIGYADLRGCRVDDELQVDDGAHSFDLAIEGAGIYSLFSYMTDEAFAQWQAVGVTSREALIITDEARDADPCLAWNEAQCLAAEIELGP